jgi:hypothetical protein
MPGSKSELPSMPRTTQSMMSVSNWLVWKAGIVATLRGEYHDLFPDLRQEDIDWEAWRPLYELGCEPRLAVEQAISVNGNEM